MSFLRRAYWSISFYPVTTVYIGAVLLALAVANWRWPLGYSLAALGLFSFLVILVSTLREVRLVHALIDSQQDVAIGRLEHRMRLVEDRLSMITPARDEPTR